jgi:drug/metabolite transporter (DMT)-like permease
MAAHPLAPPAQPPPAQAPTPLPGAATLGWGMALSATTAYSIATPVARAAIVGGFDPNALLVARMLLSIALLFFTMLLANRRQLLASSACVQLALLAGLINGLGMILYFWGIARLEASMAAMIVSTSPLVVLSLLTLRGERLTYRHLIRLALALGGLYLLIGPGGTVDQLGVLFSIGSVFAFAIQLVMIQWFLIPYPARTVTFYQMLGMTIVVLTWWLAHGAYWAPPDVGGWSAVIALAVVSTFAARLLMFGAVVRIGGGQMSMLAPLETLLSVLWSILFLGEHLSPLQWLGGLLILLSASLSIRRINLRRRRPRWRIWARV